MDCNTARTLLALAADHELDAARAHELEMHLAGCPACAQAMAALQARKTALGNLKRYAAPASLRPNVVAAIAREQRKSVPSEMVSAPARSSGSAGAKIYHAMFRVLGVAAAIALAALAGYHWGAEVTRNRTLIDSAYEAHLAGLASPDKLYSVASTDQHTVKPWFAGKLPFSPPVADLAQQGYPLAGGRLDTLAGHPAATLIFHRHLHVITLFIYPVAEGAPSLSAAANTIAGFHTQTWSSDGFNFVAVSDVAAADLAQFASDYGNVK